MNNYFLLVFLPNLRVFFGLLSFLSYVCSLVVLACCLSEYEDFKNCGGLYAEEEKKFNNLFKCAAKFFIVGLVFMGLNCFVPSKKEILQLKGISIVSETESINNTPDKIRDRLSYILDK